VRLLKGDCREQLKLIPDESVDSIVTDPPYELGFMGKSWDVSGIAYNVEVWRECLRVLKPGGHLLAFGGSRTYHRLACAVEDAGFDIRDQIMWVYATGFPKSLDVGKAIDKQRFTKEQMYQVTTWIRQARDNAGVSNAEIDRTFNANTMARHWTDVLPNGKQPAVPTLEQVPTLLDLFGLTLDDVPDEIRQLLWTLNGRKGQPSDDWFKREIIGQKTSGIANKEETNRHTIGASKSVVVDVTAPATDDAKKWDGWGTALKPAHEPVVVARKPLAGTVAQNVLRYGTGAININGCRVETDDAIPSTSNNNIRNNGYASDTSERVRDTTYTQHAQGRWPANFIHDGSHEVLELFPETKPETSAARFFYCAKASKAERNAGLEHLPKQQPVGGADKWTEQDRRRGEGVTREPSANHHPTVKPIDLMRYLIRLVTPPNGTVLDPFAGSGTTLVAAIHEHMNPIGIELTEEYWPIIEARTDHARNKT
jgi:DNA modification methylase